MAKPVADLAVNISANTVSLMRGLNKTDKRVKRSARLMRGLGRAMAKTFKRAALGAVLTGGGLGLLVKATLAQAEALSDMSKKANTSIKKLQELRFAATQNGASVRDMDDALTRLTRRMSLFAQDGGGPAAKALEFLDIEVRDGADNMRDAGVVFDEIVAKFGAMESSAKKAALASQLFGEDAGPRLLALINQGTGGLEGFRKEFNRLGLALDEAGVKKAADANAKLRALTDALKAKGTKAVLDHSSQILELAESLSVDLIPNLVELVRLLGFVTTGFNNAATGSRNFLEKIKNAATAFVDFGMSRLSPEMFKLMNDKERQAAIVKAGQSAMDESALTADFNAPIPGVSPRTPGALPVDLNPPPPPGTGSAVARAGVSIEDLRNLEQSFMTERELMAQHFISEQQMIDDFLTADLINKEEHQALEEASKQRHLEDLQALEDMANRRRANAVRSGLNNLSALMNAGSRKLFDIGKAAAIAQAIIDTHGGITRALREHSAPYSFAVAAAVAAKGFASVAAIKSQTFGGGGGGGVGGGSGGGIPATANIPGTQVNLSLVGGPFSGDQVRDLIVQINEATRSDGFTLNLV